MKHGPVGDFPLKGKTVLITGGGSGIGFALARICHEADARVLIGDLRLTNEAQEYLNKFSSTFVFRNCDVSEWSQLHDLISASVEVFGDVPDIYAPVAGIFEPPWSNFWDDTEDSTYKTLQINVSHPLKLTRLAIRALAGANKKGVVSLVASTAGIRGNYLASLYVASKHAIVGFTKSMGQADPDEGVRVVCVLPGLVDSPLWRNREDNIMEEAKFDDRNAIFPVDIALVMKKMIESADYSGGTCVLKTPYEERVVEEGWQKDAEKYDPSPRPNADLKRVNAALEKERGVKWISKK